MSTLSTHVLDTTLGRPASSLPVSLYGYNGEQWRLLTQAVTDADGRCSPLAVQCPSGRYKLTFDVDIYFAQRNRKSIFPAIDITFLVDGSSKYHIPLLLTENSYTTYRGS